MVKPRIGGKAAPVSFRNVSKVYGGDVKAVDDVSLEVETGKLFTLLGPSGCGKTTMLRMIAGLEMATSGSILIGDKDVTGLPATDRDVSMVFQSYALFPHMTMRQNMEFGMKVNKVDPAERARRIAEAARVLLAADADPSGPSRDGGTPLYAAPFFGGDEVARILIARYGPQANPDDMVTLRCDETLSIVEAARRSNAIVLTVNAVAADLIRLDVSPALDASARFGLVTLAQRQEAPALRILREQLPIWVDQVTSPRTT